MKTYLHQLIPCIVFLFSPLLFGSSDANPFSVKGPFIDEQGQQKSWADYSNSVLVVSMVYTTCRKTCPLQTMASLREIEAVFKKNDLRAQFILATFDPEADEVEDLRNFKKNQHLGPDWHLWRGDAKITRQLARALKLGDYFKMDDHVVHGFRIVVYDSAQKQVAQFDHDHKDFSALVSLLKP